MNKWLRRLDKTLAVFENSLIIALVTVMVLMAFWQVIMRNLFDAGILWGDIFLRHLVLWVGFIGASLATRDEKHISIDILSRMASRKMLPLVRIITDALTIVICGVLARGGYKFVAYEKEAGTVLFKSPWLGDVPAWIFQIIIPFGFALIGFRFFMKLLERFTVVFQRPAPPPDESADPLAS